MQTDEEILAWVARDAETALHPSCTARMGTDAMAVTDPASLRVHGLDGLRVVDASVMPYVTNGNIYAPVMMTAEKSADLILGNTPLPAEPVEFYRRDRAGSRPVTHRSFRRLDRGREKEQWCIAQAPQRGILSPKSRQIGRTSR